MKILQNVTGAIVVVIVW